MLLAIKVNSVKSWTIPWWNASLAGNTDSFRAVVDRAMDYGNYPWTIPWHRAWTVPCIVSVYMPGQVLSVDWLSPWMILVVSVISRRNAWKTKIYVNHAKLDIHAFLRESCKSVVSHSSAYPSLLCMDFISDRRYDHWLHWSISEVRSLVYDQPARIWYDHSRFR